VPGLPFSGECYFSSTQNKQIFRIKNLRVFARFTIEFSTFRIQRLSAAFTFFFVTYKCVVIAFKFERFCDFVSGFANKLPKDTTYSKRISPHCRDLEKRAQSDSAKK
jgi:hypothetical protein